MTDRERMSELNRKLREASLAYYQEAREIMSNYDYDAMYDELLELEKKTGLVLSDSVTQKVGYEVVSELPKMQHDSPMLSLDKTKSVDTLKEWLGENKGILSWKLDGLTVVLTYENGELTSAVTRGNGYIGELVTANVKQFDNVPLKIPYKGKLVLRGEAVIRYSDFEAFSGEYKNPRNLCSGSVRQLNSEVTASRHVNCMIFALVSGGIETNSRMEQFDWLASQGFEVVGHVAVDKNTIEEEVHRFAEAIETYDIPSDGLVLLLEDIAYGNSLGSTSKFPRNAIAFKWSDETAETKLRYIEWSPSRTGLINPVAVFEPVEIEGTTVSRASVHNVSIVESLKLGEGDCITVYKANMIIPQIAENITASGTAAIPDTCPVCGAETVIKNDNGIKTLYCSNPDCPVKQIKSYALLTSRDALNIEGLSEMTLEKLISAGFIRNYADIFRLDRFRSEMASLEGFGEKSADNIIAACANASQTTTPRFIYALGIPGIGAANAKALSRYYNGDFGKFRDAKEEELTQIDGIGDVLAKAIVKYFEDKDKTAEVDELLKEVTLEGETIDVDSTVAGKTFVVTGSLNHFENRQELIDLIDSLGGKVVAAVSSKTDYLINNDIESNSGKNKKAKELGIQIIDEENFLNMAKINKK